MWRCFCTECYKIVFTTSGNYSIWNIRLKCNQLWSQKHRENESSLPKSWICFIPGPTFVGTGPGRLNVVAGPQKENRSECLDVTEATMVYAYVFFFASYGSYSVKEILTWKSCLSENSKRRCWLGHSLHCSATLIRWCSTLLGHMGSHVLQTR